MCIRDRANSASTLWQAGAKLLKVKLDNHLISERMVAIRTAVPDATLIVDANESWRAEGLAARCQLLADLGVAMLEQPPVSYTHLDVYKRQADLSTTLQASQKKLDERIEQH